MRPLEEQRETLRSNALEVIPSAEFDQRLEESVEARRPLRVKLGVDPTAKDVTLGWTVVLRKLRQFQDMGHTAVLIVGDLTAQVGDPSGKSETRKPLSAEEANAHSEAVLGQFAAVLSHERLEIHRNSEWLAGMGMADVLRLTSHYTVARMLERHEFQKRFESGTPITMMEFLYPLLQGFDSVAIDADVELGGTDQTFNCLVGRTLQERYGKRPQIVLTMPLLVGTDGVRVMGQSLGNYIGIRESPDDMFGKIMSLPDQVMTDYYRLVTDVPAFRVGEIEEALASGKLHAAEAKRQLGWELIRMYHGERAADEARRRFDLIHKERKIPADAGDFTIGSELVNEGQVWLPRLLVALGFVSTNSQGRRLLSQSGVRVDGEAVTTEQLPLGDLKGHVIQVGRRNFARLI